MRASRLQLSSELEFVGISSSCRTMQQQPVCLMAAVCAMGCLMLLIVTSVQRVGRQLCTPKLCRCRLMPSLMCLLPGQITPPMLPTAVVPRPRPSFWASHCHSTRGLCAASSWAATRRSAREQALQTVAARPPASLPSSQLAPNGQPPSSVPPSHLHHLPSDPSFAPSGHAAVAAAGGRPSACSPPGGRDTPAPCAETRAGAGVSVSGPLDPRCGSDAPAVSLPPTASRRGVLLRSVLETRSCCCGVHMAHAELSRGLTWSRTFLPPRRSCTCCAPPLQDLPRRSAGCPAPQRDAPLRRDASLCSRWGGGRAAA